MTRLLLCSATQIYGQPEVREVSDTSAGRREAAAHIGAKRLAWRYWRSDNGDGTETDGIAVPPGIRIPPDSEALPHWVECWVERVREQ